MKKLLLDVVLDLPEDLDRLFLGCVSWTKVHRTRRRLVRISQKRQMGYKVQAANESSGTNHCSAIYCLL